MPGPPKKAALAMETGIAEVGHHHLGDQQLRLKPISSSRLVRMLAGSPTDRRRAASAGISKRPSLPKKPAEKMTSDAFLKLLSGSAPKDRCAEISERPSLPKKPAEKMTSDAFAKLLSGSAPQDAS